MGIHDMVSFGQMKIKKENDVAKDTVERAYELGKHYEHTYGG
jgi:hypothetical protein